MPAVAIVGSQWGDEGKGKVVDHLAEHASLVVRFQGGNNAGHTLVVGGETLVVHLLPSGVLRPSCVSAIGAGVVLDPRVLVGELATLSERGHDLGPERLAIDPRAHVILPHHRVIDALRERRRGAARIGTTGRGIGPCYEDKAGRRGVRVGDLIAPDRLAAVLDALLPEKEALIRWLGGEVPSAGAVLETYRGLGARIAPYVRDVSALVDNARAAGEGVILEGAQGTLLDIDHGTWPFVTSSTTTAGGACAGVGMGPTAIDAVVGITKAYTTRVGSGPFPTEETGEVGERLRRVGGEFGATTGRPRRCGWFDAPMVRAAARLNGLTTIALTKLDVLTGLERIPTAVDRDTSGAPVFEYHEGWTSDITGARTLAALPRACRRYIARLEALVGVPIDLVSVGPERDATIGGEALLDRIGLR